MIERLLVKDHLSFKEADLTFAPGLIAFTGPSGAGKSVLMRAFLALFGFQESDATLLEAALNGPLALEEVGIEAEEPNVLRCVKQKSVRYFVNGQMLSRKNMTYVCKDAVRYLSVKESNEFSPEALLSLLDGSIKTPKFAQEKVAFGTLFAEYKTAKEALKRVEDEERRVEELREFARFEIQKIEEVSPKLGEDDDLMRFKKMLSKKEKLEVALSKAEGIFEFESAVHEALSHSDIPSDFFDASMNELRMHFEQASERLGDLEEADVEALLDRIEKISTLKNRYGTIEEILAHLQKRKEELSRYENIAFEKKALEERHEVLRGEVKVKAAYLSSERAKALGALEARINGFLKALYLHGARVVMAPCEVSQTGADSLEVVLEGVEVRSISSGEFNRLRLAFIATAQEVLNSGSGVLILDEVDANLSGKESMSVANVLKSLSRSYQIFAISHQPQLSSKADQHFVVEKKEGQSIVRLLSPKERVEEVARMVSGEAITSEARELALSLLEP
ncbi:AAA family ATPase [Sulfurospirillum sp. T05]|uniref:DNA repair protein RecN n=1 Tax=Sulfurospirillum tamanense TaxID=2813362 RepID=A0ABS2WSY3_9BACT|nr:AAA family ATPase [Sulfurospirillum tamanensis]MBN2964750.1 AAA family ATPase [Sulfurospirillum tamanensis]